MKITFGEEIDGATGVCGLWNGNGELIFSSLITFSGTGLMSFYINIINKKIY